VGEGPPSGMVLALAIMNFLHHLLCFLWIEASQVLVEEGIGIKLIIKEVAQEHIPGGSVFDFWASALSSGSTLSFR